MKKKNAPLEFSWKRVALVGVVLWWHDDVVLELCYLNEAEVQDSCGHPEDGWCDAGQTPIPIARRERKRETRGGWPNY